MRAIRDFFAADTAQVVVDAQKDHRRIIDFVHNFMPRLKSKIVLHSEKTPLFEQHERADQAGAKVIDDAEHRQFSDNAEIAISPFRFSVSCFSLSRNVVLVDARVGKNDPDAE